MQAQQPDSDLVWTLPAIGRAIGRNPRETHYLASRGLLPGVRKVGGLYVASRRKLIAGLTGDTPESQP
jgi:hypothetical protein